MTIKTKFKPGDIVYFIFNGELFRGAINAIAPYRDVIRNGNEFVAMYRISPTGSMGDMVDINESLVGATLVDLFDALVVDYARRHPNSTAVVDEWAYVQASIKTGFPFQNFNVATYGRVPVAGDANADGPRIPDGQVTDGDRSIVKRMIALLHSIVNASESGNNGAFMGEAVLCKAFEREGRDILNALSTGR